jgi:hypothetical protein
MASTKQIAAISLTSGALSVAGYILLKRLFSKAATQIQQSKIYEEKELVDQYMLFNFAEGHDLFLFDLNEKTNVTQCFLFPKRVALLCRDYCPDLFFSDEVFDHLKILFYF